MNCFQKLLSSWHDTTVLDGCLFLIQLWIAFKNYYLRDTTQPTCIFFILISGCELLSKIIIFVTRHNLSLKCSDIDMVVNCFQKLLSSWHDTTLRTKMRRSFGLWIAFKNYYLRDTTQRVGCKCQPVIRCELLSKIIIFVTRHNYAQRTFHAIEVVNCFQKLLSSWHDTTIILSSCKSNPLWIAFKNYYLRDTTQQSLRSVLS